MHILAFMSYLKHELSSTQIKEAHMAGSVYKIIELVGTSPNSWEEAAKNAVDMAGQSLKDLRIAEVVKMDMQIDDGDVLSYRARVSLSFKIQK
jgi:flavin-binding protein dodecin